MKKKKENRRTALLNKIGEKNYIKIKRKIKYTGLYTSVSCNDPTRYSAYLSETHWERVASTAVQQVAASLKKSYIMFCVNIM